MAGTLIPVVGYAQQAAASAAAAAVSEANAATSAANATASETSASAFSLQAAASEANATASATSAATSEANAVTSETNAAASAAAAAILVQAGIGNINDPLTHIPLRRANDELRLSGTQAFTRASTGTYIDPLDGLIKTAAIDTMRFERMSDGGIGRVQEGPSTNLLLQSEAFDNAAWVKTATVIANTDIAPDGATTADTITDNSTTAFQNIVQNTALNVASTYTCSIYVMKDAVGRATRFAQLTLSFSGSTTESHIVYIDTSTGELSIAAGVTANVQLVNGYWRVVVTGKSVDQLNTLVTGRFYPAVGSGVGWTSNITTTGSCMAWGAQLEELPFATSYIPTTTTTVTRAAELSSLSFSGNAPRYDLSHANPMSIIMDAELYKGNNGVLNQHLFSSSLAREYLWRIYSDARHAMYGGVNNIAASAPDWIDGQVNRAAFVANPDNTAYAYLNGVSGAQGTITADSTGSATTLYIGKWGSLYMYGHIRNLRIYDRALTAQEIAAA